MKNSNYFKSAFLFIFLLIAFTSSLNAQETQKFQPYGSPVIVVFADYKAGLGSANDITGFNLTRARLGYQYQATASLSAKLVIDIEDGLKRNAFFHFAMLEWKHKNLTIGAGLLGLQQFELQEAFWAHRYVEKSYQNLVGMGQSTDIGIVAKYKFADWINADLTLINGEGTRSVNTNNSNKYGFGVTLRPVKGLVLRAYADIYTDSENLRATIAAGETASFADQKTIATFVGYQHDKFSLGIEYNTQVNKSFVEDCNYYGYSAYVQVKLSEKSGWFGRYDYVDTKTPDNLSFDWSFTNKDMFVTGIEYKASKNFRIAPCYIFNQTLSDVKSHYVSLKAEFVL